MCRLKLLQLTMLLLLLLLLLQDEPLDAAGTAAAFAELTAAINAAEAGAGKPAKSVDEVAMGFVRVANEAMCRPIR
jgi:5-oxoprolinase (ATP-hydrolysing)